MSGSSHGGRARQNQNSYSQTQRAGHDLSELEYTTYVQKHLPMFKTVSMSQGVGSPEVTTPEKVVENKTIKKRKEGCKFHQLPKTLRCISTGFPKSPSLPHYGPKTNSRSDTPVVQNYSASSHHWLNVISGKPQTSISSQEKERAGHTLFSKQDPLQAYRICLPTFNPFS